MTTSQNIIKSLAICLAIFIIVSIIGFFVWLVLTFTNFYDNKDITLKEYDLYDVSSIDMIIGSVNTVIKEGDMFKLEISDYTKYEIRNNVLTIKNDKKIFRKNDKVILTIPSNKIFDMFSVDTGAGTVDIDTIKADKVTLKIGAGKITVNKIEADKLKIEVGAGSFKLLESSINSLDTDLGMGEANIKTEVKDGVIEVGMGSLNLTLSDGLDNYTFNLEKGLGNIDYKGSGVTTGTYGDGTSKIKASCGVGNIKIGD